MDETYLMDTWSDVVPIPNPQNPNLPLYVNHSKFYDLVTGLFRYVMDSHEISERARMLVSHINKTSISDAYGWRYRQILNKGLGYDPHLEAQFLFNRLKKRPKPYQAWNHLKWIVNDSGDAVDIVEDLDAVLWIDSKNFHAWSFALWYARTWKKADPIFKLTTKYINLDQRNNSAWSARDTLCSMVSIEVDDELARVFGTLDNDPDNQAVSSYLLSMMKKHEAIVEKCMDFVMQLNLEYPESNNATILRYLAEKRYGSKEIVDQILEEKKDSKETCFRFMYLRKNT